MRTEILTLCDYARAEPTGKLYVMGSFDHIFATQEPILYPLCAIAARIRFERTEQGPKNVFVSFIDSDGSKVMPDLHAQLQVTLAPQESTAVLHFVVVIPQIQLPRFGEYEIALAVDSRQEASIPLYVHRQPAPGIGGPPQ